MSARGFDAMCNAWRFIIIRLSAIDAKVRRRGVIRGLGHAHGLINGKRRHARRVYTVAMMHQAGVCPVGREHGSRVSTPRHA
eukprot:4912148-Pleurochrysis_carterae.AAC.4